MSRGADILPLASQDIVEIAAFIAGDSPRSAARFVDAVRATVEFLSAAPKAGRSRTDLSAAFPRSLRSFRVWRFPNYVIFYLSSRRGITVVRVLHGSQSVEDEIESPSP